MEALLLLESCLDPKWLKPWYRSAQQKMHSTSHLLRLSTPAAVALRLFSLDRALLYDKVCARGCRVGCLGRVARCRLDARWIGGWEN